MKPQLPVTALITETYAQLWAFKGRLALAVLPGLAVSLAIVVLASLSAAEGWQMPPMARPAMAVAFVAFMGITPMAALRAVLEADKPVHFRLWKGEVLTLIYGAVMLFIAGFFIITAVMPLTVALEENPSTMARFAFFAVVAVLSVVVLAGVSRMLLAFPATALDKGPFAFRLAESWYSVKDNAWRLFIVVFFVLLPWGVSYALLEPLAAARGDMAVRLLGVVETYVVFAVMSVALALVYRFLEENKKD